MQSKFLSARWENLIMVNYEIDPAILKTYIPPNTELDLWNNTCYVSLVGFMFLNTKVLGLSWPFHRNFEEVNLRFYVKHFDGKEWKRGVVFIKEIVPRSMITLMANALYKEHYCTRKMGNTLNRINNDNLEISYSWTEGKSKNHISVKIKDRLFDMQPQSVEEFIAEHYWGYTAKNNTQSFEYAVEHPKWQLYPLVSYQLNCDFKEVYGEQFAFLQQAQPNSVFVAKGSEILVRKPSVV